MYSIDQNCHPLWDVIPKLEALAAAGRPARHFVEDIDAAFTLLGSDAQSQGLHLVRERFHHSGGADWGAAMFYSNFLGRQAVDLRDWEPYTGLKTNLLAKQLGRSPEELFNDFSPGDTWQLVGPSYCGDSEHHRIIGDLSVAECGPFLRDLMAKAQANLAERFAQADSRQRLAEWFSAENSRLAALLDQYAGATLAHLYQAWMRERLGPSPAIELTSQLFSLTANQVDRSVLEFFLRDYDLSAGLYNQALKDTAAKLRPLKISQGELPMFAITDHQQHRVRVRMFLRNGRLVVGEREFALDSQRRLPVDALLTAGITAIAGKAVLLVIQVRSGPNGCELALPYKGSIYMPAAHALASKLRAAGLLTGPLAAIVRVRLHLLDRLADLDTVIRLPPHLAEALGKDEVPAKILAQEYQAFMAEAAARLESFKDPAARQAWQERTFPQLLAQIRQIDARRRELAAGGKPEPQEIRGLWKQVKALQTELLEKTLRQIDRDWQASQLDYWDSRGAVLACCMALGGRAFYDHVLARVAIDQENA